MIAIPGLRGRATAADSDEGAAREATSAAQQKLSARLPDTIEGLLDEVIRLRRLEARVHAWADAMEGQRTEVMGTPEPSWRKAIPRCVLRRRELELLAEVGR